MKSSNKIIFNTIILYGQLLIGVVLGLLTTRIVLDALGETDYGIYAIVGGVVAMLGILNSNMANTSMRFMSYSLGKGDKDALLKTFNTTLFLHFVIGAIVIVLMEVGGWLMFEYMLNIPNEKIFSAKIVFHFMVLTTFISVISVPYDAVMNSHENLLALSIVDVIGYVLKLGLAILLLYCSSYDLLIIYGLGMMLIQLFQRIIKQYYSRKKYDECMMRFKGFLDKKMAKEILSFTSWNLLGSLGALAVSKVRELLINMFFGVKLNAASGISSTVSSKINLVAASIGRAINPQLIKSEGGGQRERMHYLTEVATKYPTFVLSIIVVPVFFELDYLLGLWLKTPPELSTVFCQLVFIAMLIEKLSFPLTDAIRAVGNIRAFQLTETIILILSVPISYFVFKSGASPESMYIIGIGCSAVIFFERLFFGRKIAKINIKHFLCNAIIPSLYPIVAGIVFCVSICYFIQNDNFLRFIILFCGSVIVMSVTFWFGGMQRNEKEKTKELLFSYLRKILIYKK